MTEEAIQAKQSVQADLAKVTVALTNPKSPSNVGAVMRAAGCYQVDQVLFTGKRYAMAAKHGSKKLATDTKKASRIIPLTHVEGFENVKQSLANIPNTAKIVCVDLVEGATPLPHFHHPEHAIYVFGPEDGTISQHVIDAADEVVYVPTIGCMNLAASVNVLLYDRLAKTELSKNKAVEADNELIRQSRDTNNKVKVKVSA